MSLSAKERQRSYDANHLPCRNECGARVYWRDGRYCTYCAALPERWCFECSAASHTAGSVCHNCDKPLGRLTFGFDRLSDSPPWGRVSENQRVGGWTDKTPHPDAVWHEAEPTALHNGVQMVTEWPVFKAKAPGIGYPRLGAQTPGAGGPPTTWMRKSVSEVNWYSCGGCGQPFGPGDGARGKTRKMLSPGYGFGQSHDGPLAHVGCGPYQWEKDALTAAYLKVQLSNEARHADEQAGRTSGKNRWADDYLTWADPAQAVEPEPETPKGLLVNGEYFPPGYTRAAAEYEQSTRVLTA